MTTTSTSTSTTLADIDVDVLIVGAGISGIGAGVHLTQKRPGTSFAILEARDAIGGTWDLFRYPGIRSDSDLHTFGYAFKPWTSENAIADAHEILSYLQETVDEYGLAPHIHFGHKILGAAWSSQQARWTVRVERTSTGETFTVTCGWLFAAPGYYNYAGGYTPEFDGRDEFTGTIVHPQAWPEDLDYSGKRVVVIGSGATAVTLIPAMADRAAHVTMLQRSPSYIMSLPKKDPLANGLGRVLPRRVAYGITRKANIARQRLVYELSMRHPQFVRGLIRSLTVRQLPKDYPVDTHFKPQYNPWEQRLCAVPDGDLFKAIRQGKASVVTDRIERFTATGILLASGQELQADIIVTATGLNLQALGGITLAVDGQPVSLPDTVAYKSMLLSGVPNFAFAFGYTNSSWTLKVDLVCEHLCRILDHMDATGADTVAPVVDETAIERRPMLDLQAGYIQRAAHTFPSQGSRGPWTVEMSYKSDRARLLDGPVEDPALQFSARAAAAQLAAA